MPPLNIVAEAPSSALDQALSAISSCLESLEKVISTVDRRTNVLQRPVPRQALDSKTPNGSSSPLIEILGGFVWRINRLEIELREIVDSLDT